MDKIELVVTHQTGIPVDHVWSAVFGMAGGTIGRAGQNKLVLPDADAAVARVHAMVRLDSDHAYIANLCERRSVLVNGLQVLAGQEVPLVPGAEIGIGPYQLITNLPGEARREAPFQNANLANAVAARLSSPPTVPLPAPASGLIPQTSTTALNLASLPNPWADIPSIVGGESYLPELTNPRPQDEHRQDDYLPSDNPFAILGRVDTPTQPLSATHQARDDKAAGDLLDSDTAVEPAIPREVTDNAFAQNARAARSMRLQSSEHRAMVIPDDFDPFAADPKEISSTRDAWTGDLVAKSLEEVAQLKHDELLQSLPKTSQFAGEMDNAAHTGLPKQLDPSIELNPLKLFREPGETIYADTADHGMSRGSDLTQVFSMPREVRNGLHAEPEGLKHLSAPQDSITTTPAFEAGLQPTQGLDLGLFEGTPANTTADLAVLDGYAEKTPGLDAPHLQTSTAWSESHHESTNQQSEYLALPADQVNDRGLTATEHTTAATDRDAPAPSTIATESLPGRNEARPCAQALAEAFLDGAGIAPDRVALSITPEFMRTFGEAIRIAVQGSIDLLSARAEIKREFRADVTIIASGANNPLKFLPTAEGVMLQLTGQTFPGFMKPVPAMQEAYNDLAVHQLALMAGIRAAYAEATARLSPAELEMSASKTTGFLTKVSALHRKAALWEDYQQRYESIRRHAEDDLMAFSGKTFVEAYENAAQTAGESL
ncbi:MAG: type VI secretion system-associated FHA domain protein TagH [Gammaproteobacteria bacterium]|nr:type VI secretion system-associated FHA domain protein TagH [Gammaproteobacteria bacterium]MBU1507123.1 type VI secretion system-associated FHA domain protein TagH [Gammaproteobacteria bacterium]MBU2121353.1 type VI secretion system-associated FHA domain protein TagH [Gammaproteobacteria bacterium]MBU2171116.1 type VI secretion system-associated FHA domain protein TagH [Gammaproteobacteria bacterium]MBU2200802.1 type VI secretion system-associated FHA domain protein TagH [Gammaproteobacteria